MTGVNLDVSENEVIRTKMLLQRDLGSVPSG